MDVLWAGVLPICEVSVLALSRPDSLCWEDMPEIAGEADLLAKTQKLLLTKHNVLQVGSFERKWKENATHFRGPKFFFKKSWLTQKINLYFLSHLYPCPASRCICCPHLSPGHLRIAYLSTLINESISLIALGQFPGSGDSNFAQFCSKLPL